MTCYAAQSFLAANSVKQPISNRFIHYWLSICDLLRYFTLIIYGTFSLLVLLETTKKLKFTECVIDIGRIHLYLC